MAREGLFSSIAARVPGASVLDLYAGTGALGIEALSRGAERAVLVEASRSALRIIGVNLERTGLADRATVVASDVPTFLRRNSKRGAPFDLVLADPPYETAGPEVDRVLAGLASGWLAEPSWIVALTRRIGSSTPVIPVDWLVARRLEYGDTLVLVYREV